MIEEKDEYEPDKDAEILLYNKKVKLKETDKGKLYRELLNNNEQLYSLLRMKYKYGHPEFYRIIMKMCEIHNIKNKGYGIGDPLGNFKECERFGVPAWKGALVRLTDKYARTCNLVAKMDNIEYKDAVKMESIEDTLIDLANYSILTLILLKEFNAVTQKMAYNSKDETK